MNINRQRGIALYAGLFFMLLTMIAAAASVSTSQNDIRGARSFHSSSIAFHCAESTSNQTATSITLADLTEQALTVGEVALSRVSCQTFMPQ